MKKNDLKEEDFNQDEMKENMKMMRTKKEYESKFGAVNEDNIVSEDELNIPPEDIEKEINQESGI